MTYSRSLAQQIEEIEHFLSKASKLIDSIKDAGRGFSDYLFWATRNDLSRITRIALCSVLEDNLKKKQEYRANASKLCGQALRKLLETHIKFCVEECGLFQYQYRRVPIGDTIRAYQDGCHTVKDIEDFLVTLTANADVPIEDIKQAFEDISAVTRVWNAARPEMDKKKKSLTLSFLYKIAGIVASIAVILSALLGTCRFQPPEVESVSSIEATSSEIKQEVSDTVQDNVESETVE